MSVVTAALALFLFGGIRIIARKIEEGAQGMTGRFEMTAFMTQNVTQADVHTTIAQIRAIPGVGRAVWIPRDKVWKQQIDKMGFSGDTSLIPNTLPESFKIVLSDLKASDRVADAIRALPKMDKKKGVSYMRDEQRALYEFQRFVNWIGGVSGSIVLLLSGVLIFNTTRLAIANRRAEIRIMRLVGAHWLVVDLPFLIEGIVFGTMGGVLATLGLSITYTSVAKRIVSLASGGTPDEFPYVSIMQTLSLSGAAFGFVCASLAIWIPEKKLQK